MSKVVDHDRSPLGRKDQIDILLHEYDTLRDEMLERHSVLSQAVGFGAIIVGGTTAIFMDHWEFCLVILALAAAVFLIETHRFNLDTAANALRVFELERQINELAGRKLLVWETEWGMASPQFQSRDRRVKAKISMLREAPKRFKVRQMVGSMGLAIRLKYGMSAVRAYLGLFCGLLVTLVLVVVIMGKEVTSDANTVIDQSVPWMNNKLSPDERADLVIARMTLDEKIQLTHGKLAKSIPEWFPILYRAPTESLGGAGFVRGISRLGIPNLQMVDAGSGVTANGARRNGSSTALPCPLALTATWNTRLADDYGTVIGMDARAAGFNMVLGGAVNLARESRSGRLFENHGEEPVLAGKMVAPELSAIQKQGVIATIKHFAVNDQETGRYGASANLDIRSLRETDLLAFEIGILDSGVGTVMCAYNRVNEVYACENTYLLSQTLKDDWGFKGWAISDWGAAHSTTRAALAGLDQELPFDINFGKPLKRAVEEGSVPLSRLDDMVHRILRTMFGVGLVDAKPGKNVGSSVDGSQVARRIAQEAIVLLKNHAHLLPLDSTKVGSIAVIGSHADVGVLSGGGSSQILPKEGSSVASRKTSARFFDPTLLTSREIWLPSSPLRAIKEKAPKAVVNYVSGTDIAEAKRLASRSHVVLLFAHQWRSEGFDLPTLSLPGNQDALIAAVAEVNPRTIVVLETGGPVLMPWLHKVSAVLEAWYPGASGSDAIADVVFGNVNPSGKLPITFPNRELDLPHPTIAEPALGGNIYDMMLKPFLFHINPNPSNFDINYSEGLNFGQRWLDVQHRKALFPFGFGLSYTEFEFSNLHLTWASDLRISFWVANVGSRSGAEVAQVYLEAPAESGEPRRRLIAWDKIMLKAGVRREVVLSVEPKLVSIFDARKNQWNVLPGNYNVVVGSSSQDIRLSGGVALH